MQPEMMTAARADIEALGKILLIKTLAARRADFPQCIADGFGFCGSAS